MAVYGFLFLLCVVAAHNPMLLLRNARVYSPEDMGVKVEQQQKSLPLPFFFICPFSSSSPCNYKKGYSGWRFKNPWDYATKDF